MKMDFNMILELDRKMLLDFYSLGAWVHQYTATALYHEAQRIANDTRVALDDRPRIQMVLRVKILVEVVSAMETLGRFCFSIRNREKDGIATCYINMRDNKANEFYNLYKLGNPILPEILYLPEIKDMEEIVDNGDLQLESMNELINRIAVAYLDDQGEDFMNRKLKRTYNAIKHGSHIINNIKELVPIPADFVIGEVPIVTRWPYRNEAINNKTMIFTTRSMSEEAVLEDLKLIGEISIVLSTLSQLIILLIDKGLLSYGNKVI
ncbi:hypothetical protein [Desulfosporosinus sp. FKB]|uniref:hypothetical protein n=1 Tax=Desulfosporosinus sp. FKB TaxID=1969835 RepID=UPI000B49B095|nr:hypothetical protein [Desulfosporosinus sp. FKB]